MQSILSVRLMTWHQACDTQDGVLLYCPCTHLWRHVVQCACPQEWQLPALLDGQPKVAQPQLICRHAEGSAGRGAKGRQLADGSGSVKRQLSGGQGCSGVWLQGCMNRRGNGQCTSCCEEDVFWLDVTVHHAVLAVQHAQHAQQRRDDLQGAGGISVRPGQLLAQLLPYSH